MSGFRPPLDVSAYVDALGDPTVLGGRPRAVRPEPGPEDEPPVDVRFPCRAGYGPVDASSATTLVRLPQVIWDVNGYYRRFGFSMPYTGIGRRELRLAYLAHDGESSILLTKIFKFLLNDAYRRLYNLAPLGEIYLDDIQQERLIEKAEHEAARRTTESQRPVKKKEVFDEWGYTFTPEGEDESGATGEIAPPESDHFSAPWPWGYYLWGSASRDTARLARWQNLLREVLARQGVVMRFCVGLTGRARSDSEWSTGVIGTHLTFFLREDVWPTDTQAADAVASALTEHQNDVHDTHDDEDAMTETAPKFGRGGGEAKEKAKQDNARQRTSYLSLKSGESTILRFLDDSDQWIYTKQHAFVPTKPAPKDADNWPKRMGAVCRHDQAFEGMFSDCHICDAMVNEENGKPFFASTRLWARAVVRKEVLGTEEMAANGDIPERKIGKRVGIIDSIVEVPETNAKGEATGKTVRQPEIILVNQGLKNFFSALQAIYEIYATILDRDFVITREGDGKDTDYSIVPLDPIKTTSGEIFTLEDPEVRARYVKLVDLEKHILGQASDEYYARFFDPTKTVESKRGNAASADEPADEDEAPSAQPPKVNKEALEAMRRRVKEGSGKPAPKPAPADDDDDAPVALDA